jgi:aldose 1-epimerase
MTLITLENTHWRAGILPETGASLAYGSVRQNDQWVDVFRPTDPADYGNSSQCASFIMLPWCNRIKDGVLRAGGQAYQLRTTKDDGTARHGDVRGRAWKVTEQSNTMVRLALHSDDYPDMNWPFRFMAGTAYWLEDHSFHWSLDLTNVDTQPFPAGFGHHPYFVKTATTQIEVPCSSFFELNDKYMATASPVPIPPELDFRHLRSLPDFELNHLLSGRTPEAAIQIQTTHANIHLRMTADPVFEHILVFAPAGKAFVAVEPMTNASDGFNLYADGQSGSGVFVVQPGETRSGHVQFSVGAH